MRVIAFCALVAGCGQPEAALHSRAHDAGTVTPLVLTAAVAAAAPAASAGPTGGAGGSAPGSRLGDDAVPVSYDLTLDLDPARDTFAGHVAITIALAAPATARLWLNAVDLEITRARLASHGRVEDVALLDGPAGSQLRGFALAHPVGRETVTLVIDYTGHARDLSVRAGKDEEGLFRERAGGRWYLYSQAESIFARKIVPCFDEPRWKPAWRVTAIVPRDQIALGNAPVQGQRALPDGRTEVRFAPIAALPSYLLAIAVGPFELVDAGKLGRGHVPVRLAVLAGDGGRVAAARRELPRIIDALERYLDAPLPVTKLDLVAVPQFFGAMENTGLVLFDNAVLVGGHELVLVVAHELAHQWFGNSVTPAWWEHLWLSEAFATWLGERVAAALGAALPPALAHRARVEALVADDREDARALVHPIASSEDIEPAFDAIAYEKGAAVLATFERFAGSSAFQAAVHAYLAANAGASVTSQAFLGALAAAVGPAASAALASNLAHAGTPVVDLALRCGARPALVASARDGVTIPVCVRFPAGPGRPDSLHACFLAGEHTEHALPGATGCPAWIVGNDGGAGYYRVAWRAGAPAAPISAMSPDERLTRGDDAELAVRRGELAIPDALAELTTLAATHDPYGQLAALAIAGAIDPLVEDRLRPAWAAWLAPRFADRLSSAALSSPRSAVDHVLRARLVELALGAIDPATLAALRTALAGRFEGRYAARLRLAAARDPGAALDRLVATAAARPDEASDDVRDALLDDLGAVPASLAPRVVDLAADPRFAPAQIWPAVADLLERGDARGATWRTIHDRFGRLAGTLTGGPGRAVLAATAALCDPQVRAEVAADFGPRVAAINDGARVLARALAEIDRCIARRAAAGDLARALAATPIEPGAAGPGGATRAARALTPPP
ncbi:MAG TPA: M1 family aminopeptidase [Kofleriaceae bacterium]|nr:M1 family aminopeptidase [Kofleriaceae bacterium]